jgi:hypothetical protein
VFKVADTVHLRSGYYSVKFEKYARLGMIAPTWTNFPITLRSGHTSVLLQLAMNYEAAELEHELRSLDPRTLLFLRKLKQIDVEIFNKLGHPTNSILRRCDIPASTDGAKMVNLYYNAAESTFKITTSLVSYMPPEPKRVGCTTSEVLLAFPITQKGEPWIASQNVYAFLPIRDYGLKVSTTIISEELKLIPGAY